MRSDRDRLLDILEAIENIRRYRSRGREAFDADELIQSWTIRHLEVVGEACAGLSDGIKAAYPSIPWRGYVGMRNVLVHQYFGIDLDPVWLAATVEVDELHATVLEMLENLSAAP